MTRLDPKVKRWRKDIDKINQQIQSLLLSRYFFEETINMVRTNQDLPQASTFFWWRDFTYAHAMLIGIRRFIDKDKRSISLLNLLYDIKANNRLLTKEYFLLNYIKTNKDKNVRREVFKEKFGEKASFVQKRFIEEYIKKIEKISKKTKKFINKRIAHLNRESSSVNNINYGIMDDCLNEFEEITIEWQSILKGITYMTIRPSVADNWKKLFIVPWIKTPNSTHASQSTSPSEHLSTSDKWSLS